MQIPEHRKIGLCFVARTGFSATQKITAETTKKRTRTNKRNNEKNEQQRITETTKTHRELGLTSPPKQKKRTTENNRNSNNE